MTIARPRLCAACVFAIILIPVPGPGDRPARAFDAPVAAKSGTPPTPAGRKPAKGVTSKIPVPFPPTKPALSHPAGWPAAPIDGAPANPRGAGLPPAPSEKTSDHEPRDSTPQSADAPPEAEEQNFFQRMIRARTRTIEPEPNDPRRRDLAEPPDGYRRPAQDTAGPVETEGNKSSGLFGSIGALWDGGGAPGKTTEAEGASAAPKPAPDPGEAGGLLGKIGGMLPGFLRGSDKK